MVFVVLFGIKLHSSDIFTIIERGKRNHKLNIQINENGQCYFNPTARGHFHILEYGYMCHSTGHPFCGDVFAQCIFYRLFPEFHLHIYAQSIKFG